MIYIMSVDRSKEIFAIAADVKYALPENQQLMGLPFQTAHSLMPELFGYDIVAGKPRISLPYFGNFLRYRNENNLEGFDAYLVAKEFSTTTAAQEAIQETLSAYRLGLSNILSDYPEGKLTLSQGAMVLSLNMKSLKNAFGRLSIELYSEKIRDIRDCVRPTPMIPVDQMDRVITWRYPESYPTELIPPGHLDQ